MSKENKNIPQVLLAVHINSDKEIENIDLVSCFVAGDFKHTMEYGDNFDEHSLHYLLDDDIQPDALYHVYARIDWCECGGYDCREWDSEITIFNVIPVILNYEQFLKEEEDYQEQEKLADGDSIVDPIECTGEDGWGWNIHPTITYNEFYSMAQIVAKHDIKLAHRLYSGFDITQLLGELYDSELHKIENRRLSFKHFIRRNNHYKTRFTKDGYDITYWGKIIHISFDAINSIPDELLLENDFNEDLLKNLIDEHYAPFVMEELLKYN